ncbi:hypothetical protein CARUB_v10016212mg [Capsella rubella]|uniref:Subtilisin-like protease fibronectin type-III domain-containing protein n=1 Tax=Capsella rubella TaxID=81985 RepID=R0G2Z0_9BRAS|nr:hypothetical protein CARUB_v10016212mg [Capsella rubella]
MGAFPHLVDYTSVLREMYGRPKRALKLKHREREQYHHWSDQHWYLWPESESFSDKGFSPPPPNKWRGACEGGKNFSCKNKLIGARYYGMESARDNDGHGSHTASIAASNTNRAFVTKVVLGDGKTRQFSYCTPGCLDTKRVRGKILLCDSSQNLDEVQSVGAVAAIVKRSQADYASIFSFSVSVLSEEDQSPPFVLLRNAKAAVLKSETIFNQTAPITASYSSRGPNTIVPDILKPDITAPGSEILAAYSPNRPLSQSDARHVKYSIISGTSMSCPHISGVAAFLKTFHPRWSASMIQSAIMTTAQPMKASTSPSDDMAEFAYGAGHVSPIAAVHPGLVYELTKSDHITFLCGLNYTGKILRLISVAATEPFNLTFRRTVTNVGKANSNYKAKVLGSELTIRVIPDVLSMKSMYNKRSFTVVVSGKGPQADKVASAHLIWSDGSHSVKSPIVIYATK